MNRSDKFIFDQVARLDSLMCKLDHFYPDRQHLSNAEDAVINRLLINLRRAQLEATSTNNSNIQPQFNDITEAGYSNY